MESDFTGTGKWVDVLKLYEADKCNVSPGAQNMMKVSLAVQVMSSTVSLNDT